MAKPIQLSRKDAVLRIGFDPDAPTILTNVCGAKKVSLSIKNEIIEDKLADCDDINKKVEIIKDYGPQNSSISLDASMAKQNYTKIIHAANDQLTLNFEIEFIGAAAGELHLISGKILFENLEIGDIGSVEGAKITESMTFQVSGGLGLTDAT